MRKRGRGGRTLFDSYDVVMVTETVIAIVYYARGKILGRWSRRMRRVGGRNQIGVGERAGLTGSQDLRTRISCESLASLSFSSHISYQWGAGKHISTWRG